jgi:hypothetical protein
MSDDAHFRSGQAGLRPPWTAPKPCGRAGSVELFGPERGPVNISSVTCRRTREFRCRPVGERRPGGGADHKAGRTGSWAPQAPRDRFGDKTQVTRPGRGQEAGTVRTACGLGSRPGPSSHFQVPRMRTVRVRLTTNGTSHVRPRGGAAPIRAFNIDRYAHAAHSGCQPTRCTPSSRDRNRVLGPADYSWSCLSQVSGGAGAEILRGPSPFGPAGGRGRRAQD